MTSSILKVSGLIIWANVLYASHNFPASWVDPLATFRALYFSMVPSGFRFITYTHFVSTILVPSGIFDLLTLVNTLYFSN